MEKLPHRLIIEATSKAPLASLPRKILALAMNHHVSAFEAALSVCWALLVAVGLAKLSGASVRAPAFLSSVLVLLVVLQFYFVYQAARVALIAKGEDRNG